RSRHSEYWSTLSSSPLPDKHFSLTTPPPSGLYTLSLHDALPISASRRAARSLHAGPRPGQTHAHKSICGETGCIRLGREGRMQRSEEHTSELQSPCNLVCRLLLEKKKTLTQ